MRLEPMNLSNVGMLFQLVKNPFEKILAQTQPFLVFLIRTDTELLGWISLQHITSDSAELGICLLKPFGLFRITQYVSRVVGIAFTVLHTKEVLARTDLTNLCAIRLLEHGHNKGGSRFTRMPDEANQAIFKLSNDAFLGE